MLDNISSSIRKLKEVDYSIRNEQRRFDTEIERFRIELGEAPDKFLRLMKKMINSIISMRKIKTEVNSIIND